MPQHATHHNAAHCTAVAALLYLVALATTARKDSVRQDTFIGKQIDDFIVQERLSLGSRSMVYRAFQQSKSRDVALKITRIDRRLSTNEDFRTRFQQESQRIAHLDHPNILPIYTTGVQTDLIYVAMRLTNGGNLETFLQEHPEVDISLMTRIISQLGRALAYAHKRDIVHYDLKPANILLDVNQNVYLTDFGFSRHVLKEEVIASQESLRSGGLLYVSPEQFAKKPLTPRSDVFSLGMILYRLAVGRLPYRTDARASSVLQKHLQQPPPAPRLLNPNVPPVLETIIMKSIERDPAQRYATTEELVATLNRELESLFETPEMDETPSGVYKLAQVELPAEDSRGLTAQRLLPYSLGITLLVVLLGVVYILLNPPIPPPVVITGEIALDDEIVTRSNVVALAQRTTRDGGFIAYIDCPADAVSADEDHSARLPALESRAAQYDIPLRIYQPPDTAAIAIADGAKAILYCGSDAATLDSALTSTDVHMVIDDNRLVDEVADAVFIRRYEFGLGYTAGAAAGDYVLTAGAETTDVIILVDESERADGLIAGLRETAPQAELVGELPLTDGQSVQAALQPLIGAEQDIDVLLTPTDDIAYSVIEALEGAGYLPEDVAIFSVGAEPLARQYIADGYFIVGSAHPDQEAIAHTMVDAAVVQLGGGAISQFVAPRYGRLVTAEQADG